MRTCVESENKIETIVWSEINVCFVFSEKKADVFGKRRPVRAVGLPIFNLNW